jgi:hypothetical protein
MKEPAKPQSRRGRERQGWRGSVFFPPTWRLGGLAALLSVAGCERGSLARWLISIGVGADHGSPTEPGSVRLHEVDCPAGLARCVGGIVQMSRAFRHPEPCKGSPEACACPWQIEGRCSGGCVADDIAIPFTRVQALAQLCTPGAGDPTVGGPPPLGTPPPMVCGDERYRCSGSTVVSCDASRAASQGRIVAFCTRGCVEEGTALDDESLTDATAVLLFCSR